MTCPNQSGLRNITLIENRNISFVFESDSIINWVYTDGQRITIDNINRPAFEDEQEIGSNFKLMHNYTLNWLNFDLVAGMEEFANLSNGFGWLAALEFNDGATYLIASPLMLQEDSALDASNTHTWEIKIKSEVNTFASLVEYNEISPIGIGTMEVGTTFIIA